MILLMKKRLIAMLLVLIMAMCIFPISAFADSLVYSDTPISRSGWTADDGYKFRIGNEIRTIPYGEVCSQTYNNTVYNYVHTVQYILFDFAEYYENNNYNPNGTTGSSYLDGLFGSMTASAVRYYQGRKGLSVDGAVGDQTWQSFVNQWVFG